MKIHAIVFMDGCFSASWIFAATLKGERPTTGIKAEDGNCDAKKPDMENPGTKDDVVRLWGQFCIWIVCWLLFLIYIRVLQLPIPSQGIYATKLSEYSVNRHTQHMRC